MKDLKELLNSVVDTIELSNNKKFSKFLTEEADYTGDKLLTEEDDPFGGDAGGDAGADPFGGDAGGDVDGDASADPFASDAGGNTGASENAGEGNNDVDGDIESESNDDTHEDDPEFSQGKMDNNDVTLTDVPAAKSIYDIDKIMNTVTTVFQSLSEEQLVENEKVKAAIELIFNGKILNEEDLEFTNLKNALFLIRKIGQKLDTKTRNYLNRKIKEPLIKKRDQIKQDIASKKGELANTRDMLTSIESNSTK